MGKEKALLSFIAVFIGLLVAGIAFYFYENSKAIPTTEEIRTAITISPSPTPQPSLFLNVDQPKDEEVVQKKIITISGKTTSDATIVILAGSSAEEIISPSSNGDFSTTITINNGQNVIEIAAITPNKQKVKVFRTVTFSTEEF